MSDDKPDAETDVPEGKSRARLMQAVAKRLQNPRQLSGDAMELLGVVLESSDRAKTEAVKMIAREVRNYLEELKLSEDLYDLVTSHSLEVKMSLKLEPLDKAARAARRGGTQVRITPTEDAEADADALPDDEASA